MKIYRFPHGGITFKDETAPTQMHSSIGFLPGLALIPLSDSSGSKIRALVGPGDILTEAMLIGRGEGPGAANIHAPIPGKVLKRINMEPVTGKTREALLIRLEGSFSKLGRHQNKFSWESLSTFDIQRLISEKGLVEMEEPGRPLVELLHTPTGHNTKRTLVIRCVFDDPWRAADRVVCLERTEAVLEGALIAAKAGGAHKVVLCLSEGEKELESCMDSVISRMGIDCRIITVGARYPQSNSRELELVLREFEKREEYELNELLILCPSTLVAVYDALCFNKPILERYIAVGGSAVKHPKILRVRIGTRIGDVFAECGGFKQEARRIAFGSPLSGKTVKDLDEPITKTSYALFAFSAEHIGSERMHECTNCGDCRAVCPVCLDPERLFKLARAGNNKEAVRDGAGDCHGCGCCEVVCPSRLPLSSLIRQAALRGRDKQGENSQ